MYSDKNTDNKYDLYGCIYHLPICHTPEKVFLKQGDKFDFKSLKNEQEELEFMNDIYIKNKLSSYGGFYYKDEDNNEQLDDETNPYKQVNNLYYKNIFVDKSFEENIYYYSVVEKDNTLEQDEEARSQECILSIINCFKSCKKCDNIGDINNNNCEECDNDNNYYFIEDKTSKQCLKNDDTIEKYYFDNNEHVFKRCYASCKKCEQAKDGNSHNCLECDIANRYYPYKKIICW